MGSFCTPGPTTSTYTPNATATGDINQLLQRINSVSQTPYQPYGGQLVAGLSPTQQAGISNINAASGIAQPYINQAANYATSGAAPVANVSASDISKYYNPYQQDVIDAAKADMQQAGGVQQNQIKGNAAAAGALGGDRLGVAQAELAGQQARANNSTLANLRNTGWQQSVMEANSQQQNQQANANRQGQAAYTFGNLGAEAQNLALSGAQAQIGAGGIEQQNQQAQLNAAYQQYMQAQGFPYAQTGWAAGLSGPLAGALGGTQSTQQPAPSPFQIGTGLGAVAGSFFKADGGRVNGYDAGGSVMDTPTYITGGGGYVPHPMAMNIQRHNMSMPGAGTPNASTNPFGISSDQMKSIKGGFDGMFNSPGDFGGSPETNANLRPMGGSGFAHGGLVDAVHAIRKSIRHYRDGGDVAPDRLSQDIQNAISWEESDPNSGAVTGGGAFSPMKKIEGAFDAATGRRPTDDPLVSSYVPEDRAPSTRPMMTPRAQQFVDSIGQRPAPPPTPAPPPKDYTGPFSDMAKVFGYNGGLSDDERRSLRAAGFGILAAPAAQGPLAAIGQGGLRGLAEAQEARKEGETKRQHEEMMKLQNLKLDEAAAKMAQTAFEHSQNFGELKKQRDTQAMQPVHIGTTPMGQEIFGIRNRKTGEIDPIDPATGRLSTSPPAAGAPPDKVSEDTTIPSSAKLVAGGRDADYLQTIPTSEQRNLIERLADYQINPNSLSIKGGHRERLLGMVTKFDPEYDQAFYPARAAAMKEFTAGGNTSPAGQITAGNTAIQHAGEISDAIEEMKSLPGPLNKIGKAGIPIVSYAANHLKNELVKGTPEGVALAKFLTAKNHYVEEVTKFYAGSGGSEAERTRALKALDEAKSIEELRAAVQTESALMHGKVNSLQERWKNALGGVNGVTSAMKRAGINDFPIIQQKSVEALDKIKARHENVEKPKEKLARPDSVPAGSAYSASRKMWRTPDGQLFDAQGKPVQ